MHDLYQFQDKKIYHSCLNPVFLTDFRFFADRRTIALFFEHKASALQEGKCQEQNKNMQTIRLNHGSKVKTILMQFFKRNSFTLLIVKNAFLIQEESVNSCYF
ncbi:MAG: hypothetical protein DWQ33_00410 [Bacteroidetes bacterium]|nr:MAG: hypothetical protein DWQ33_00410 [Bacteroidota bacterium]